MPRVRRLSKRDDTIASLAKERECQHDTMYKRVLRAQKRAEEMGLPDVIVQDVKKRGGKIRVNRKNLFAVFSEMEERKEYKSDDLVDVSERIDLELEKLRVMIQRLSGRITRQSEEFREEFEKLKRLCGDI